jgi:hypothetical protein
LLVGRRKYKSDKLFGKWVKENGFGDIDATSRKDALWLAENGEATRQLLSSNEAHPTRIRQAYNEYLSQQEDSKASPDLPKVEDIKPTMRQTLSVSLRALEVPLRGILVLDRLPHRKIFLRVSVGFSRACTRA